MADELYTIGHSNHEWDAFAALLRRHDISAIADVRSSPYSKRLPQFNADCLEQLLKQAKVQYVFLGDALGGRADCLSMLTDGRTDYAKLADRPAFRDGLKRLRKGMRDFRIALMCSEREPLDCHRTILVCRRLRDDVADIRHILADGGVESHVQTEQRMLANVGLDEGHLFADRAELIEQAYDLQGRRIAYAPDDGQVVGVFDE